MTANATTLETAKLILGENLSALLARQADINLKVATVNKLLANLRNPQPMPKRTEYEHGMFEQLDAVAPLVDAEILASVKKWAETPKKTFNGSCFEILTSGSMTSKFYEGALTIFLQSENNKYLWTDYEHVLFVAIDKWLRWRYHGVVGLTAEGPLDNYGTPESGWFVQWRWVPDERTQSE